METCNKGRGRKTRCARFVAEITIDGKRHRRRSTNCNKVRAWLDQMNADIKDKRI